MAPHPEPLAQRMVPSRGVLVCPMYKGKSLHCAALREISFSFPTGFGGHCSPVSVAQALC